MASSGLNMRTMKNSMSGKQMRQGTMNTHEQAQNIYVVQNGEQFKIQ
jgi:hypothetical protein